MKRFLLLLTAVAAASCAAAQGVPAGWLELPRSATFPEPSQRVATVPLHGTDGRSFTFLYDTSMRVSLWVAYPLNASLIGEGSRGDGWHPSPYIAEGIQPALRKGFPYGSGYDRGHQIPSADRLSAADNDETFAYVNATPQLHDFNGGIWAELEKAVRTWAKRSDTLYVVTGIVPSEKTIGDNDGRPVNIPAAYYKVVLRRNTDRGGTVRWSMCSVLLFHKDTPKGTWKENMAFFREHSLPVDDLEVITGEDFFPNLRTIVGAQEAEAMEAQSPRSNDWWWK